MFQITKKTNNQTTKITQNSKISILPNVQTTKCPKLLNVTKSKNFLSSQNDLSYIISIKHQNSFEYFKKNYNIIDSDF